VKYGSSYNLDSTPSKANFQNTSNSAQTHADLRQKSAGNLSSTNKNLELLSNKNLSSTHKYTNKNDRSQPMRPAARKTPQDTSKNSQLRQNKRTKPAAGKKQVSLHSKTNSQNSRASQGSKSSTSQQWTYKSAL